MDKWHKRVAVVTGASSGIGASCVVYLIKNNMKVVGLARRQERMMELRSKLPEDRQNNFIPMQCDITDEAGVCAIFKRIESEVGPIAVLINNAGILRLTELVAKNNTKDIRDTLETNVMGVVYCTREAFRSMKSNGGVGHVVLINSIGGHKVLNSDFSFNMYPASKHAITAMTEVYRQEFSMNKTNVKITSISPGRVDTEIFDNVNEPKEGAFLHPDDVADAVIYCLQTPPHVQIHELTIKPLHEKF